MPRENHPTDDRGVPCKLASLSAKQIGWRALGLPSVTKDPIIKLEQSQQLSAIKEIIITLVGGIGGWLIWSNLIRHHSQPKLGVILDAISQSTFAVVIAMIVWYIFLNQIRKSAFASISEVYLAHGHCASCGYKLEGLSTEQDECLLCPECNAAWLASRVGPQTES